MPVWLSFTLEDVDSGSSAPLRLRGGELLSDALCVGDGIVTGWMANCSTMSTVSAALPLLRERAAASSGFYGAQPNLFTQSTSQWLRQQEEGHPGGCDAGEPAVLRPDDFARWGAQVVKQEAARGGARVPLALGGCCGSTPAHIARLTETLLQRETKV